MSFPEQEEDKIVTFALAPTDYYFELKLAKFLNHMDKIEGPTIEDLAVWAHNFAIGALSKQLGQLHIVSLFKQKQELDEKKKLFPDVNNIIPGSILTQVVQARNQAKPQPPQFKVAVQPNIAETEEEQMVDEVQKELVD
jgi:hypothetical protein